jgi:hypothetical protein
MPKQIASDALGELIEIGKATASGAKQVITGVDKVEKADPSTQTKKPQSADPDAQVEAQIERMKAVDKKQSAENYKQVQNQISLLRRQKASQPRKYETGSIEYNEEKQKNPESWWEKQKKKMAATLPWTSKQGMGTGEIRRGASG